MYGFCSKLCLAKPVKVIDNRNKTVAYYEIVQLLYITNP
jgi:hypothetical protein